MSSASEPTARQQWQQPPLHGTATTDNEASSPPTQQHEPPPPPPSSRPPFWKAPPLHRTTAAPRGQRYVCKTRLCGTFYCPACQRFHAYRYQTIRRRYTALGGCLTYGTAGPRIEDEYVQCQACQRYFQPNVLVRGKPHVYVHDHTALGIMTTTTTTTNSKEQPQQSAHELFFGS